MIISPTSTPPKIILASSSRYRRELLSRLGLPFHAASPDIDESPLNNESPDQTALRLAQLKAQAIATQMPTNTLIIGSDQVASLDGQAIGKPGTFDKALAQLSAMRGRRVCFHTALCLIDTRGDTQHIQTELINTYVTFRDLPTQELAAYLRIEQPYDCAGSAKNEGLGITIIEKIDNTDPTALTGLPLIALTTMLRNRGLPLYNQ